MLFYSFKVIRFVKSLNKKKTNKGKGAFRVQMTRWLKILLSQMDTLVKELYCEKLIYLGSTYFRLAHPKSLLIALQGGAVFMMEHA